MTTAARPRFTIVSAVYNVARYLDEFIAAVEGQTFDLGRVEVIMVDDGSTDGESLAKLRAWQQRRPDLVTALTKPNGGQGSARNLGLEHARGEWVTFTDPDDTVHRAYLAEVDAFLRDHPSAVLAATNRKTFDEVTGAESPHPLNRHFTKYNRLRDLDYDVGHFHGHASGSFFRLDLLREQRLRFDDRVRPTFEDGHFCCSYLLEVEKPIVGYLAAAVYNYRKRGDRSSTLDLSWADPDRFTAVPEHGYLQLLERAQAERGYVPRWLQGMVIYELTWYLKTSDLMYAQTSDDPQVMGRFHELMGRICALLEDETVAGYEATWLKPELRDILRFGYRAQPWHTSHAYVDKLDMQQRSMRVAYRFTGPLPDELYIVDGSPVVPLHQKIRDIKFFDKPVLQERIVWLPYGTVRVVLDGTDLTARLAEPDLPAHFLDSWAIRLKFDRKMAKPRPPSSNRKGRWSTDGALRRFARTKPVRRVFGDAWVLIDRIINADDSAEHLFRYLRDNRPEINAWFVLERGSPDWDRLRSAGYRRRTVPHGSFAWKLLMLNAQHLISSHIDHPIVAPEPIMKLIPRRWRFTFLQHGVIKDDISNWLNGKDIDVFVTSTPGEPFQHIGILSLEFHVDKLSRPLL